MFIQHLFYCPINLKLMTGYIICLKNLIYCKVKNSIKVKKVVKFIDRFNISWFNGIKRVRTVLS